MSAARIAARLRERLPEADGWRVFDRTPDVVEVRDAHGAVRGAGFPGDRTWVRCRTATTEIVGSATQPALRGDGWPERLADALADALLGTS
jgi:hypothetical protein